LREKRGGRHVSPKDSKPGGRGKTIAKQRKGQTILLRTSRGKVSKKNNTTEVSKNFRKIVATEGVCAKSLKAWDLNHPKRSTECKWRGSGKTLSKKERRQRTLGGVRASLLLRERVKNGKGQKDSQGKKKGAP